MKDYEKQEKRLRELKATGKSSKDAPAKGKSRGKSAADKHKFWESGPLAGFDGVEMSSSTQSKIEIAYGNLLRATTI